MQLTFAWDIKKAQSNQRKHGVTFGEARTIFGDSRELMIPDPDHSEEEERFLSVGMSDGKRILLVSYTEAEDQIRLISARLATSAERKQYEENI
jgi:uncharacterized protein